MVNRLVSVDEDNNLPADVQAQLVGSVETYFEDLTTQAQNAATTASTSAGTATSQASNAAVSATQAQEAAETATAPTDEMVASLILAEVSATYQAMAAEFVGLDTLVINVQDHGAVADFSGTTGTDNLAAFNAAQVATPEGGVLYAPAGRYFFSDVFVLSKSVNFTCGTGGGFGSVVGTQLIFAAGKSGVEIRQDTGVAPYKGKMGPFSLKSLSTVAGTDVGIFVNAGRWLIEGVTVDGFGSHGILVKAGVGFGGGNANNTYIQQPRCYGNRGAGIRLEGTDANACIIVKADVVANYGWGIEVVSSAMNKIIAPHADQQYNGSPGAYRDAGNSNDWDWLYVEGGGAFLMDTGSSNGRLSCSMYGAPTVQHTGSVHLTWRVQVFGGAWFNNYVNEGGTQKYRVGAGGVALDSFDIINATSGERILSVNASNTRIQHFTTQQPNADGTLDIGASATRWRNGFFSSYVRIGSFTTATRPSPVTAGVGAMIYDSSLGLPLWSTGAGNQWRDAAGTVR